MSSRVKIHIGPRRCFSGGSWFSFPWFSSSLRARSEVFFWKYSYQPPMRQSLTMCLSQLIAAHPSNNGHRLLPSGLRARTRPKFFEGSINIIIVAAGPTALFCSPLLLAKLTPSAVGVVYCFFPTTGNSSECRPLCSFGLCLVALAVLLENLRWEEIDRSSGSSPLRMAL